METGQKKETPLGKITLIVTALLLLCSCGGIDPSTSALSVAITDAPACGLDHVYVTITRVRVHESTSAAANDSGWQEITPALPLRVDLLSLSNGAVLTLGKIRLPAGEYRQLRLVLAENTPGNMANAVVPTGGSMQALDMLNTLHDGLVLMRPIAINPQAHTKLVLDFDACRSIVQKGDGSYGLNPVLTSTDMHQSGGITGYVSPGNAGASVYAQINGEIIKGTVADSSGRFVLAPVSKSTVNTPYDIVIAQENYSTTIITGIPVSADAETVVSTTASPIVLTSATMQAVSGSVIPARALATLYAKQEINGKRYVTRLINANADTGDWSMRLSNSAPLLASFGTLPLSFSSHSAEAGRYSISAVPLAGTSQNYSVDISASAASGINADFCTGILDNFGLAELCSAI